MVSVNVKPEKPSALQQRSNLPSLYTTPPQEELSLDEFELLAVDRLELLRAIEALKIRGAEDKDLNSKVIEVSPPLFTSPTDIPVHVFYPSALLFVLLLRLSVDRVAFLPLRCAARIPLIAAGEEAPHRQERYALPIQQREARSDQPLHSQAGLLPVRGTAKVVLEPRVHSAKVSSGISLGQ